MFDQAINTHISSLILHHLTVLINPTPLTCNLHTRITHFLPYSYEVIQNHFSCRLIEFNLSASEPTIHFAQRQLGNMIWT